MLYIKYMPLRSAINASRNQRELMAAKEFGFETAVFSNDFPQSDTGLDEQIERIYDGSVPLTYSIPRLKRLPKVIKNHMAVYRNTWKLTTGIWSCHDLASLRTAWIITRFRKEKPQFIYDSHEFELGRNAKRGKMQIWLIRKWESFLIKRCVFSIMVNDSIANEVQGIHRLKQRPIVVRSVPNYWDIDKEECRKVRQKFEQIFTNRLK